MKVIDLSHHNHVTNWQEVRRSVDGVILRSTYGISGLDKDFNNKLSACARHCIPVIGLYHFVYVNGSVPYAKIENDIRLNMQNFYNNGVKQFFNIYGEYPGFVFIDWEYDTDKDIKPPISAAMRTKFWKLCEEVLASIMFPENLSKIGFYINQDYSNSKIVLSALSDKPIWFARYGKLPSNAELKIVQLHQYSSDGNINGINGKVDLNVFSYRGVPSSTLSRLKQSKGEDVKLLQERLNTLFTIDIKVDGIFGKETEEAVKSFQASQKITADGVAGYNTILKLWGC